MSKIPEFELKLLEPVIDEIIELKQQKNAVVLAHNYMPPSIFYTVADFTGDSLALAQQAAKTHADIIVQAGVFFMAETSKIICPDKMVLIPDTRAGCSLAASITGADVILLREKYPNYPIITYVNTSAEVKAESDVCCTSSNATKIVEAIAKEWETDTVIMIPDEYLAQNIAKQTKIKIITWKGHCEVHERFTAQDLRDFRRDNPGIVILAHPECRPDVLAEADFAGSTSAMSDYVGQHNPRKVVLVTECSMSDNVSIKYPNTDFVRPCNLCPHMHRITLENILESLKLEQFKVEVNSKIREGALLSINKMLELS